MTSSVTSLGCGIYFGIYVLGCYSYHYANPHWPYSPPALWEGETRVAPGLPPSVATSPATSDLAPPHVPTTTDPTGLVLNQR